MRSIVSILFALWASSAQAQQVTSFFAPPSSRAGTPVATITANLASTSFTIPSNFVGVRGEVGDFVAGLYQGTTGSNGSFMNIVKLLGSAGVFSLGGNSAEAASAPAISQAMANNLNSFVTGIGASWTLNYDLDAFANDSASAATTASRLATAFGTANVVFQFGNEPSTNFTQANYITLWNAYYTAVTGAVSGVKLAGVDDGMLPGSLTLASTFSGFTPGLAGMQYVSTHFYTFGACSVLVSPAVLLSTIYNPYNGTPPFNAAAGWIGSTPQRMTETNTICGKGFPGGVSDRLMAATWFVNVAISLAKLGWAGINIQSYYLGTSYYNIATLQGDSNYLPTPIFYGMYLFSKIQGQQIVATTVNGNGLVNAIATKGGGGNANIIAANNDPFNKVTVIPAQSSAWTTANVLLVQAGAGGGCSDTTAMVGGAAIGESGAWSGSSYSINNGASVQIPPCGAALIQIQP